MQTLPGAIASGRQSKKKAGMEKAGVEETKREMQHREMRYASTPELSQMERRTLEKKQINGPTAAHAIEEVHVPLNYAYLTFTTGSSAFQTPVGVTWEELSERKRAGRKALQLSGVESGSRILVTYPPLINVFYGEGLTQAGIRPVFLSRSSREALLKSWCCHEAEATIGESSFLRAALTDASRLGLRGELPQRMKLLAAGTPLEQELADLVEEMPGWELHDLYGCQEFGWLTLDGVPLRTDLRFISLKSRPGQLYPIVGGIPTGDCFCRGRHRLNPEGVLCTHSAVEPAAEWEVHVLETTALDSETVKRASKSILRIKSRIVRVDEQILCGCGVTKLALTAGGGEEILLSGPKDTLLFDTLLEAQINYQKNPKKDGTWIKR